MNYIKRFVVLILILSSHSVYGQGALYIDQRCGGNILRPTKITRVMSLSQVSSRINHIIKALFKKSLTDFASNNIVFMQGQILDIENYGSNDSSFQEKYEYPLPKYFLEFEIRDSSIGIHRYCLQVSLDQYGQVLKMNWPRNWFNKRETFVTVNDLKNEAVKFAKNLKYKTDSSFVMLAYNGERRRLDWEFYFFKEVNAELDTIYEIIAIDPISKELKHKGQMWQSNPIR